MDIVVLNSSNEASEKIAISSGDIYQVSNYGKTLCQIRCRAYGNDYDYYYALHSREDVQSALAHVKALQDADSKASFPALVLPNGRGARPGADAPKVTGRILDLTTTPISIEEMLERPAEPGRLFRRRVELSFEPLALNPLAEASNPAPVRDGVTISPARPCNLDYHSI